MTRNEREWKANGMREQEKEGRKWLKEERALLQLSSFSHSLSFYFSFLLSHFSPSHVLLSAQSSFFLPFSLLLHLSFPLSLSLLSPSFLSISLSFFYLPLFLFLLPLFSFSLTNSQLIGKESECLSFFLSSHSIFFSLPTFSLCLSRFSFNL